MYKPLSCIYALLLAAAPMSSVLATEGIVAEWLSDCPYIVVEVDDDYAVMEWNDGTKTERNDRLSGNYSTGSMNVLENVTRGGTVKVWIEAYPLPKDDALQIFREECR